MKKLADEVSIVGKCEQITMMDLRREPGEVFASVALGKVFIVTKAGKPVGIISKPPGETLTIVIGSKGEVSYRL